MAALSNQDIFFLELDQASKKMTPLEEKLFEAYKELKGEQESALSDSVEEHDDLTEDYKEACDRVATLEAENKDLERHLEQLRDEVHRLDQKIDGLENG